jgi:O-6-methylguanine DNA methyltransferase
VKATISYTDFDSPIGRMWIASTDAGVCQLALPRSEPEEFFLWLQRTLPQSRLVESSELNTGPIAELIAYSKGQLQDFTTSLDMWGTEFQRAVWQAVARIPYGETRSYADIARLVGRPRAFRAVGAANGANPLPLFVPCHRVIGADGALTGYGGGVALKEQLLKMEQGSARTQP